MDNNISAQEQQEMENWKKILIMDPLLNTLLDSSTNPKDFIHQKVLTLQHEDIVRTYSKLSSIKHMLSKRVQKQVQSKFDLIQESFMSKHNLQSQMRIKDQQQLKIHLSSIQSYNKNYTLIQENLTKLQNINQLLSFTKSMQKLKITLRLIKTFMKDYSPSQPITQTYLNLPKITKLLKELTDLIGSGRFGGIKLYQNQKEFINNTKAVIYSIVEKILNKRINQFVQMVSDKFKHQQDHQDNMHNNKFLLLKQEIIEKFKILISLNKIKQYITAFFNTSLKHTSQILKALFNQGSNQQFSNYFCQKVWIQILQKSTFYMTIEEMFYESKITLVLQGLKLPNLYQRYMQKVKQYLRELIKWTMDQQSKQLQKKHPINSLHSQLLSVSTSSVLKLPLFLKYPLFLSLLTLLLNRIHQQLLLGCVYNLGRYQFFNRKQEIIIGLERVGIKFWEGVMLVFYKDDQGKINQTVKIAKFLLNHLFLCHGTNILANVQIVVQQFNEKLITFCEKQSLKVHSEQQKKQINQLTKQATIPQLLKSYCDLTRLIDHIKRIKQINKIQQRASEKSIIQNQGQ